MAWLASLSPAADLLLMLLGLAVVACRAGPDAAEAHQPQPEGHCGLPERVWDCAAQEEDDEKDVWGTPRRQPTTPFPKPCPDASAHAWCDPDMDTAERVDLLVNAMTTSELAHQVSCDIFGGVPAIERLGVNAYNYIRENNHGLLWNDICPIPTMFPQAITLGASFNKRLWQAIGEAAAMEARFNHEEGKQNSLFLQTNFNLFLDPRWGRGQETPGECPTLASEYVRAWTAGVQAPKGPAGAPLAAMSCKHFAAYHLEGAGGWPQPLENTNRHNFDARSSEADLADTHYPVFQACAAAGAKGMMTAYNAVNGVPMAANGRLTNGLFRDAWGFKGAVVTDCGAVEDMWLRFKHAADGADAARRALAGGTDIECGSTVKKDHTEEMKEDLRKAVKHSFGVRFELGEFDPPQEDAEAQVVDQAAHARLAFDAAVQGSVLLRNQGGLLPLKQGTRVAVYGPMRDMKWQLLGNYAAYKDSGNWSDAPNVVSVVEGLQSCGLVGGLVVPKGGPGICSQQEDIAPGTGLYHEEPDNADVVLIVAGLYPQDQTMQDPDRRPEESGMCQAGCLESEGCDRPHIALPLGQERLIRRALKWKKPVVLVVMSGGPLDLSGFSGFGGPGAILWMGYPGQQAGTALAHMLFGLQSPSGRLPVTFYKGRYADQVNMRDLRMRPDRSTGHPGRTYRFVDEFRWIVYPFGYGLSYHTWQYGWRNPTARAKDGEDAWEGCSLAVKVLLQHQQGADCSEPVLLFLRPPFWSRSPLAPRKELKRFERVAPEMGQEAVVQFDLAKRDFLLVDHRGNFNLLEGTWHAEVGSPAVLGPVRVRVTGSGCTVLWGIHHRLEDGRVQELYEDEDGGSESLDWEKEADEESAGGKWIDNP